MKKRIFVEDTLVRTDPGLKDDLKMALLRLKRSPGARFNGKPPSIESTTAALWMWFSSLPVEKAEAFLSLQYPALAERVLGGARPDVSPEDQPGQGDSTGGVTSHHPVTGKKKGERKQKPG